MARAYIVAQLRRGTIPTLRRLHGRDGLRGRGPTRDPDDTPTVNDGSPRHGEGFLRW